MIPYGRQSVSADDIAAVVAALESDWLTCGPRVEEFEQRFAEFVRAEHAVAVNSGTAALHLAMLAAGIGPGDHVITSPNTFLASANAAAFVGATPDFCDIDRLSYTLCPDSLRKCWRPETRAVVAVDYAGHPSQVSEIAEFAHSQNAIVIEDACHSIGGVLHSGKEVVHIGGNNWADMTTFSFHPVKSMTTGEGGMLTTNNPEFAQRARTFRSHGMIRQPELFTGLAGNAFPEQGPWYYEMQELGYNYRITDLQCALGISQLQRLPRFLERRREIVQRYHAAFQTLPHLTPPAVRAGVDPEQIAWHLYTVLIDFQAIGKTRTDVMSALRERGVATQVLYIPVYLQPWYAKTYGYKPGKCPNAEWYYERALSLPLFPAMTDEDVETVIQSVKEVLPGGGA